MIVYYLAFIMLILLIISIKVSDQNYASPAIAFLAPFSFAIVGLIFNIDKWKVDLQLNTLLVIVGGSICFLIPIFFAQFIDKINKGKNIKKGEPTKEPDTFQNNNGKINKIIFLVFQIMVFLITLSSVINISKKYGNSGSVSEMISSYKKMKSYTTEDVSLGKGVNFLYDFCYASGFIWIYILINNYFIRKKIELLSLFNLIMSIAISLEKGSRGGALAIISAGISLIILLSINNSEKKKLPLKHIVVIITGVILIIGSFQFFGEILGRKSSADFTGYLFVYFSAPIRNLDYFLNNVRVSTDVFGKMTFIHLYNYIGRKIHYDKWIYEFDLPPLKANGYVTGNVYTTFYAYVYDFGYEGVLFCMIFMGLLSWLIYKKALSQLSHSKENLGIWMVVYSYIFYLLAFSFFSNKFYEGIFCIQFIKYLIYWNILIYYVQRIKIKI